MSFVCASACSDKKKKKEEQTQREAIMKQVPDGSFFLYTAQVEQLYKINIPENPKKTL